MAGARLSPAAAPQPSEAHLQDASGDDRFTHSSTRDATSELRSGPDHSSAGCITPVPAADECGRDSPPGDTETAGEAALEDGELEDGELEADPETADGDTVALGEGELKIEKNVSSAEDKCEASEGGVGGASPDSAKGEADRGTEDQEYSKDRHTEKVSSQNISRLGQLGELRSRVQFPVSPGPRTGLSCWPIRCGVGSSALPVACGGEGTLP